MTVEALFSGLPAPAAAAAHRLLALVRAEAPGATEAVKPGWQLVGFTLQRYFCAINPKGDHVRLLFEQGVALPDPDGVLLGRGSQMRWLSFASPEEIDEGLVRAFVQVAITTQQAPLARPRRSP